MVTWKNLELGCTNQQDHKQIGRLEDTDIEGGILKTLTMGCDSKICPGYYKDVAEPTDFRSSIGHGS